MFTQIRSITPHIRRQSECQRQQRKTSPDVRSPTRRSGCTFSPDNNCQRVRQQAAGDAIRDVRDCPIVDNFYSRAMRITRVDYSGPRRSSTATLYLPTRLSIWSLTPIPPSKSRLNHGLQRLRRAVQLLRSGRSGGHTRDDPSGREGPEASQVLPEWG